MKLRNIVLLLSIIGVSTASAFILHEDKTVTLTQIEIENTQLLVARMKQENEELSERYMKLYKQYKICKGKTKT